MAGPEPNSDTIERLTQSAYPAFTLLAGMQLDVFTQFKDGPITAAAVALGLYSWVGRRCGAWEAGITRDARKPRKNRPEAQ